MIHLYEVSKIVTLIKAENRMMAARGWAWRVNRYSLLYKMSKF